MSLYIMTRMRDLRDDSTVLVFERNEDDRLASRPAPDISEDRASSFPSDRRLRELISRPGRGGKEINFCHGRNRTAIDRSSRP
jgi:hypothetical protein